MVLLVFHEGVGEALSNIPYWLEQSGRNPQGIVLDGSVFLWNYGVVSLFQKPEGSFLCYDSFS